MGPLARDLILRKRDKLMKREETRLRCVSRLIEGLVRRKDLTHPPPTIFDSQPDHHQKCARVNKASSECALFPKEYCSAATDFEHPRKEKRETK